MSSAELEQKAREGQRARRVKKDDFGMVDVPLLVLVLLLTAIGLIMLFSASYARALYKGEKATFYLYRQGIWTVLGLAAMFVASQLTPRFWMPVSKILYVFSLAGLVLVLLVGKKVNGATRWIELGSFGQLQPSEIAKFALICLLASIGARYRDKIDSFFHGVVMFVIPMAFVAGLLVLEPHLSATVIVGAVTVVMMYASGTKMRYLAGIGIGLLVVVVVGTQVLGYAGDRITAWLDPYSDTKGDGYQIIQSQLAIGSGGLFGLGFGKGRQKYLYLPESQNDYIFAIVCEELGLVGALGIIVLFALLVYRGFMVAIRARDRFSSLLGVGIMTQIAVQTVLNLGVVTNLLPSTGVSLPFFSYGGTSLLMQLGEMGIMLAISRYSSTQK